MLRWLLVLFLTVASAPVWAQPAATDGARQTYAKKVDAVSLITSERTTFNATYERQLREIDQLKQGKKTWNRERELKEKLAAANETGEKLRVLDQRLATARRELANAQTSLVNAIDAELKTNPPGERANILARVRLALVPPKPHAVRRIAVPSLEIDPRADPEDLDAQAAELRRLELELDREATRLDAQSKQLALRSEHERARTLNQREDNTPTRNPTADKGGGRSLGDADSASPQSPPPTDGPTNTGDGLGETFEADVSAALADVVDPSTIDTLTSAQKSGDPGKRSKAAAKTRDAVKAKLDLVKQKRALIEMRAKTLRK